MKLSIKDRISFPGLYPKEGNLLSQMLIRDISEKVKINTKEANKIELKVNGDRLNWNDKVKDKEVTFSDSELEFLRNQIDRLDKGNAITQQILDLCLKIKNDKTISKKS